MAGRIKLTNNYNKSLKTVYNENEDADNLHFDIDTDAVAVVMPFNDTATDFYDLRCIDKYASISDAMYEAKLTNAGTENVASDNIIYLLNDIEGPVNISGDDPTISDVSTNFINYGKSTYNKDVRLVSASKDGNDIITENTTSDTAITINGDVNVKSITGTICDGLYNSGKGYKVGTNWLLDNVKVSGKVTLDKNSTITVTANKKWSENEVITLDVTNPVQGTVLVAYEDGVTPNPNNFKLTDALLGVQPDNSQGYVLGLSNNNLILARKTASVNRFRLTGLTGEELSGQNMTLALFGGSAFNAIPTGTDITSWFTNIPSGITAKAAAAINRNATELPIVFTGVPTAAKNSVKMEIQIPATFTTDASEIVDTLYNADYNITRMVYTITFDGNGGEGIMDPLTINQGDTYSIPECMFAKPILNCRFIGWAKASQNGTLVQPSQPEDAPIIPNGNLTYYACWQSTETAIAPGAADCKPDSRSITIINALSTQEYKLTTDTEGTNLVNSNCDWKKAEDGEVRFDGLDPETVYHVITRVAATENLKESDQFSHTAVTTLPCNSTPEAGVNYTDETFTGLVVSNSYLIKCGNETIETGVIELDTPAIKVKDNWFGNNVEVIAHGVNGITGDSDPCVIHTAARPNAPNGFTPTTDSVPTVNHVSKTQSSIAFCVPNNNTLEYKVTNIYNNTIEGFDYSDISTIIAGGSYQITVNSLNSGSLYKVVSRVKAVDGSNGNPASNETETIIRTFVKHDTPEAETDYYHEVFTGLQSFSQYKVEYTDDSSQPKTVTNTSDADGIIPMPEDIFGKTVYIYRPGDSTNYLDSDKQSISITAKIDAAIAPEVPEENRGTNNFSIIGRSNQEYALANSEGVIIRPWAPLSDTIRNSETYKKLTTYTDYKVLTRVPAKPAVTDNPVTVDDETQEVQLASKTVQTSVKTKGIEPVPQAVIDYVNETFTGLIKPDGYTSNNYHINLYTQLFSYTLDDNSSTSIDESLMTGNTYYLYRYSHNSDYIEACQYIEIKARPTPPAQLTSDDVVVDSTSISINNCNSLYEYNVLDNDNNPVGEWKSPVENLSVVFNGLSETTSYKVVARVKAVNGIYNGNFCSNNSTAFEVTTLTAWNEVTTCSIDFINEYLTGLENSTSYLVNNIEQTSDEQGKIKIAESWIGTSINLVKKGDGEYGNSPDHSVDIPARPTPPDRIRQAFLVKDTNYIYVFGPKVTQEYQLSKSDGTFTGWETLAAGETYISFEDLTANTTYTAVTRIKAIENVSFCSKNSAGTSIKTYEELPAPACTIDYQNEKVTGFITGKHYIIDCQIDDDNTESVNFDPVEGNMELPVEETWFGHDLKIMYEGDDINAAAYSLPQTLHINSRRTAPDAISDEDVTSNITVSGNSSNVWIRIISPVEDRQYMLLDDQGNQLSEWRSSTSSITFQYLDEDTDYKIVSRNIALIDAVDNNNSASKSLNSTAYTVRTKHMEETPNIAINYYTEKLTGFDEHTSYRLTASNGASIRISDVTEYSISREWSTNNICFNTSVEIVKLGNGTDSVDSFSQEVNPAPIPEPYANLEGYMCGRDWIDTGHVDNRYKYRITGQDSWRTPVYEEGHGYHVVFSNLDLTQPYYEIEVMQEASDSHAKSFVTKAFSHYDEYDYNDRSTKFYTLSLEEQPSATINYSKERISGLFDPDDVDLSDYRDPNNTDSEPVLYKVNGTSVVVLYDNGVPYIQIEENWYGSTINLVRAGKFNGNTLESTAQVMVIDARPTRPSTDNIGALTVETTKITVNNAVNSLEYRLLYKNSDGIVKDWTAPIDGQVIFTGLKEDTEYYVVARVKAIGTMIPCSKPSDGVDAKTWHHETTPEGVMDYLDMKLKGLVADATYKISVDGDAPNEYTANSNGIIPMLNEWFGATLTVIKEGEVIKLSVDSREQTIDVLDKQETPNEVDSGDIIKEATSLTINPAEESQEYNITDSSGIILLDGENQRAWITVDDQGKVVFDGLTQNTDYKIITRMRPTDILPASDSTQGTSVHTLIPKSTTEVTIDYINEVINGLSDTERYTVNDTECVLEADNSLKLDNAWFADINLSLVTKGDGVTYSDSLPVSVPMKSRPATPAKVAMNNIFKTNNTITINNVDSTQEYRLENSGLATQPEAVWVTPAPGSNTLVFNDLEAGTNYKIYNRTKAVENTSFRSLETKGTSVTTYIKEVISTPPSIDYINEKIKGLIAEKKYFVNEEEYTADSKGNIPIIDEWIGSTITISKEGDGNTTISSDPMDLVIKSRPGKPSSVSVDSLKPGSMTIDINPAVSTQEYTVIDMDTNEIITDTETGEEIWSSVTGEENIITIRGLTKAKEYKVITRLKATETDFSSLVSNPTETTTLRAENIPTGNVDESNLKITNLVEGRKYVINGQNFTAATNGTISIDTLWYGTKIDIVRKGNGTTTGDSEPQSLAIPEKKPEAKVLYSTKELTGLVPGAKYSVQIGENPIVNLIANDTTGRIDIQNEWFGNTIKLVKTSSTAAKAEGINDSLPQEISLTAIPVQPDLNTVLPTENITSDKTTIKIKPANVDYLYKLNDSNGNLVPECDWRAPSVPEESEPEVVFENLTPGQNYKIIIKKRAINIIEGEENQDPPAAPESYESEGRNVITKLNEAAPAAVVNYLTGKLIGLNSNSDYIITIPGQSDPINKTAENGAIVIGSTWYGKTILIVKKGNDETTVNSEPQSLEINAKPDVPEAPSTDDIVLATTTIKIDPANSAYLYKLTDTANQEVKPWVAPYEGKVEFTGLTPGREYKIVYKLKATDNANESDEGSVNKTTLLAEEVPSASVDYNAEKLTGLVSNAWYIIERENKQADEDGKITIDERWFGINDIQIIRKSTDINSKADSAAQVGLDIADRPAKPGTFTAIAGLSSITIQPAVDTQEYLITTANGGTVGNYSWTSPVTAAGEESKVVFDGLTEGTLYKVITRVNSTDNAPRSAVSDSIAVSTLTKEATPNGTPDYQSEKIVGLVAGAAYKVNGAETPVNADALGMLAINANWFGDSITLIKKGITGSTIDSDAQTDLSINERPDKPVLNTSAITPGTTTIVVDPAVSTDLYKLIKKSDNSDVKPWVAPSNGKVIFSGLEQNVEYIVVAKVKSTNNAPESVESEGIDIRTKSSEMTPEATVDYSTCKLNNLISDAIYIIEGNEYTAVDNSIGLIENWYGKQINIIKKGNTTTTVDSEVQLLNINSRPDKPDEVATAVITRGTTSIIINPAVTTQEYMLTDAVGEPVAGCNWTLPDGTPKVVFDNLEQNTIYKVVTRVKQSGNNPESPKTDGTATSTKSIEQLPNPGVDYANEFITDLVAGAVYTINGTIITADDTGKTPINSAWFGKNIPVIKKGIGEASVDSAVKLLAIKSRGETPTAPDGENVLITTTTITIDPANDAFEYKLDNIAGNVVKPWVSPTSGKVVFTGLVKGVKYNIVIRRKETVDNAKSSELVISKLLKEVTPNATVSYENEKITGLVADAAYTINETSIRPDADGNIIIIPSWFGNDIQIVKKGDSVSTIDSDKQILHINARPEAPAVPEEATEKITVNTTSIIINPADSACDYKLIKNNQANDLVRDWTTPIDGKVEFTGLPTGVAYKVIIRTRATAEAPASAEREVVKLLKEQKPSVSADYINNIIKGFAANASYTIDGVAKTSNDAGKIVIESTWYDKSLTIIKTGIAGISIDSDSQILTIEAKLEAPEEPADTTITSGTSTIIIKPTANDCKYMLTGDNDMIVKDWTSPSNDQVIFNGLDENKTYKIIVKKNATDDKPESEETIGKPVTTKSTEGTPDAAVNYLTEKLTGLVGGSSYLINGITILSDIDGTTPIKDNWYGELINIVKKGNGSSTVDSTAQTLVINARAEKPASVPINKIERGTTTIIINPADQAQDYKLKKSSGTDASEWMTPIENKVIFDDLDEGTIYSVVTRIRKTELKPTSPESESTIVITMTTEETPEASADYINERITGLTSGAAYTINGVAVTIDSDGNTVIKESWYDNDVEIIKKGNGTTSVDSAPYLLHINARPGTPVVPDESDVIANNTSIIINPADSTSEYKLVKNNASNDVVREWVSPENGKVEFNGLDAGVAYKILIRTKATVTASKSEQIEIIKLLKEATPTATVDYRNNKITGFVTGATYAVSGSSLQADASGNILIQEEWLGSNLDIVKKGITNITTDSDSQILNIKAKPEAPENPADTAIIAATTTITIDPADNDCRYKLTDEAGNVVRPWISPTEGKVVFADLTIDKTYKIVIKKNATENAPESKETEGKLVATMSVEGTPNATADYQTGKIIHLIAGATYTINGIQIDADEDGKVEIRETWFGTTVQIIKKGNGHKSDDSVAQSLIINDRAGRPAAITADKITIESTSIIVEPAVNTQEYRLDKADGTVVKPWISPVNEKVIFDGLDEGVSYTVVTRTKKTDTTPESLESNGTVVVTRTKELKPQAYINFDTEKVAGLIAGAAYTINNSIITADANGCTELKENWYGNDIIIIKKAVLNTAVDSDEQTITIPSRPDKPEIPKTSDIKVTTTTITIDPADSSCEYKLNNIEGNLVIDWTSPVDGKVVFSGLSEGVSYKVVVRVKEIEDSPKSDETESAVITNLSIEAAPNASIDYQSNKLTGLAADTLYSINETAYRSDLTGRITIEEEWLGNSVSIIKKGIVGISVDSSPQTLSINAKPAAPEEPADTVISTDTDSIIVNPADNSIVYRLTDKDGEEVKPWTSPSNGKVIFSDLEEDKEYILIIKKKPENNKPESEETTGKTIVTKLKETGPSPIIDYSNEQIKGLVPEAIYSIDNTNYTADDGKIDIIDRWYGATIEIIKKGDNIHTADSNPVAVVINDKPSKPAVPAANVIKRGIDNIVIDPADNTLEYKLTDATGSIVEDWKIPVDGKVEFKNLTEGGIYRVITRLLPTDTAPKSPESDGAIIVTFTSENEPEAIVDYIKLKLTGLIAKAEYTINGYSYTADAVGTIPVNTGWFGKTLEIVKIGNKTTTADSNAQSLIIVSRGYTPQQIDISDIKASTSSITVNKVVNGQEYQLVDTLGSTVKSWVSPVDGKVVFNGLDEGKEYRVMTKTSATVSYPESLPTSGTKVKTLVTLDTPVGTINEKVTAIVNLEPGQTYKISYDGKEASVISDNAGNIPISAYYGKSISIVKPGDEVIYADSKPLVITIPDKPADDIDNSKYTVYGTVKDETGKVVSDANIVINQNTKEIDKTVTAVDGSFIFVDIPVGTYSIVITYADKVTTKAIEVKKDNGNTFSFITPSGDMNTVLDISEDTSIVAVDGLPEVFTDKVNDETKGITEQEKQTVDNGGNIEIKLQVKCSNDAEKENERKDITTIAENMGVSIASILDFTLMKTITTSTGEKSEVIMNELTKLLTVYADIAAENQGKSNYRVFRYHGTSVDVISETPNADGEYIELSKDGKQVIIHVKKFSTYAIGFDNNKATSEPIVTKPPVVTTPPTSVPAVPTLAPTTVPSAGVTKAPTSKVIDKTNMTVEQVEMDIPTITMVKQMGFKSKFKILLKNTKGADITYVSSDSNIATVNNKGIISTKKKEGTVTIVLNMVKDNIASQFVVKVKVKKGIAKSYSLKRFNTNYKGMSAVLYKALTKGKTYSIGLTHLKSSSKTTYKTSNKKIATVDKNGKIKGLKAGRTNITITTKQEGITYKYFIVLRVIEPGTKANTSYLTLLK